MKFFISGKSGRIGSIISENLSDKNISSINFLKNDLLNKKNLEIFFKNNTVSKDDWLIICHGIIPLIYKTYRNEEKLLYESNVKSCIRLIEGFLSKNGKNIIFISTLSVYTPSSKGLYINQETIENPVGIYGRSKLECEQSLISTFLNKGGDKLIILRSPRVIIGFFQQLKLFSGQIIHYVLSKFFNIFITRPFIKIDFFLKDFFNIIDNFKNQIGIFIIIPKNIDHLGLRKQVNSVQSFHKTLGQKKLKKSIFVETFVKKIS